jgi:hypothetical protein
MQNDQSAQDAMSLPSQHTVAFGFVLSAIERGVRLVIDEASN